ncbi:MAG: hypothetical protein ACYTAF_01720, partial [Planctomycetota bacterium]
TIYSKTVPLVVYGRDGKFLSWKLAAGEGKDTSFNNVLESRWKKGELVMALFEFESGGKKIILRSPIVETTLKEE